MHEPAHGVEPFWSAVLESRAGGRDGRNLPGAGKRARVPLGGFWGVPIDDRARRRVRGYAICFHDSGQGARGSLHAPASDS
jgi:hypothetical protein